MQVPASGDQLCPSLSLFLSLWPLCCVCACGVSVAWCPWCGLCGVVSVVVVVVVVCVWSAVCGVARNKLLNGSTGLSSPLPKHVARFPHRSRQEPPSLTLPFPGRLLHLSCPDIYVLTSCQKHIHMHIHIRTRTRTHIHMPISKYPSTRIPVHLCACTCTCTYTKMYTYMLS